MGHYFLDTQYILKVPKWDTLLYIYLDICGVIDEVKCFKEI